jgi:WD40 repeat protein
MKTRSALSVAALVGAMFLGAAWSRDVGAADAPAKPKVVTKIKGRYPLFSPDGTLLVISEEKKVKVYEVPSWKEKNSFAGDAAAFSSDGKILATADAYHDDERLELYLWDVATWKEKSHFTIEDKWASAAYLNIAFSPDGKLLVVNTMRKFYVRELTNDKEPFSFVEPHTVASGFAILADNKTLVSVHGGASENLKLWELSTGKATRVLAGHSNWIQGMALSRDGKLLATASGDKTIKIWDAPNLKELKVLKGHEGIVESASFTADGKYLLSGSQDEGARVWDVESGKSLTNLEHAKSVFSVAISPDGKYAAARVEGNMVYLWDIAAFTKSAK